MSDNGPVVGIRVDLSDAEREIAQFLNSSSDGLRRIAALGQQAFASAGAAATPQLGIRQAAESVGIQRAQVSQALRAGEIGGEDAKAYRDFLNRTAASLRAQAAAIGENVDEELKLSTGLRRLREATGANTRATAQQADAARDDARATEAKTRQTRTRMSAEQRAANKQEQVEAEALGALRARVNVLRRTAGATGPDVSTLSEQDLTREKAQLEDIVRDQVAEAKKELERMRRAANARFRAANPGLAAEADTQRLDAVYDEEYEAYRERIQTSEAIARARRDLLNDEEDIAQLAGRERAQRLAAQGIIQRQTALAFQADPELRQDVVGGRVSEAAERALQEKQFQQQRRLTNEIEDTAEAKAISAVLARQEAVKMLENTELVEEEAQLKAQELILQRQQRRLLQQQIISQAKVAGLTEAEADELLSRAGLVSRRVPGGPGSGGPPTRWQRAQGALFGRDPESTQTLGQFFGQRALSTAAFAVTGSAFYLIQNQIREIIREATELQTEFRIIESVLEQTGQTGEEAFGRVREGILRVARETAVSATEVARSQRLLAGIFADPETLTPDYEAAAAASQAGFELQRITGLPTSEINDALSAIAVSFGRGGTEIEGFSDLVVGLGDQFGVTAAELTRFGAQMAASGSELGFTERQILTIGAALLQVTESGQGAAEQFGRVLPGIAENSQEIIRIFSDLGPEVTSQLAQSFGSGDLSGAFAVLLENFQNLSRPLRNEFASLIGGSRQAGNVLQLFGRGPAVLNSLDQDLEQFTGRAAERFDTTSESVQFAFDRLERAVEQFGIELFEAGLADALIEIADAASGLVGALSPLLDALGVFDGLPIKILATVAAFRTLSAIGATTGRVMSALQAQSAATAAAGVTHAAGPFTLAGPDPYAAQQSRLRAALTSRAFIGGAALVGGQALGSAGGGYAAVGGILSGAGLGAALGGPPGAAVGAVAGVFQLAQQVKQEADAARQTFIGELNALIEENKATGEATVQETYQSEIARLQRALEEEGRTTIERLASVQQESQKGLFGQVLKFTNPLGSHVLNSLADGAVNENEANLKTAYEEQYALYQRIIEGLATRGNDDAEVLLDLVEEYGAGSAEVNRALNGLLNNLRGGAYGRFAGQQLIEIEGDPAVVALENEAHQRALNFEEAMAAYELGVGSQVDVLNALTAQASIIQQQIEAASDNPALQAQLRIELLENLERRNQIIEDSINERFDFSDDLASIFLVNAGESAAQQLQSAEARLAALQGAGASSEAIREAAVGVIQAQRAVLDDRISSAEDVFEALRIAESGLAVDIDARVALIQEVAQTLIQQTGAKDVLSNLVKVLPAKLNLSVPSILDEMVDALIATGNAETAAVKMGLALLNEKKNALIRFSRFISVVNGKDSPVIRTIRFAIDAITQQMAGIRDVVNTLNQAYVPDTLKGDVPALRQQAAEQAAEDAKRAAEEAARAAEEARRAMIELQEARFTLLEAMVENDPVAVARIAQQRAAFAYQVAQTEAEQILAEAERIRADRQLQDALNDIINSQIELAMAYANAAGDSVQVAQLQLQQAITNLQQLQASGAGQADLNRAQAEIVNARAGVRDANLQDQQEFYQYLHDMGQITTGQLVSYLQSLLQIPDLTEDQIRDINLQIKRLRSELASDLQFNLPSDLNLPTLYEVRRLTQSSAAGLNYQAAQGVSNDNRIFEININGGDPQQVFDAVTAAVNAPPRSGNYAALY